MNSLISICIPTYHRPELLRQAIESCLNQSYPNIEIIISDDSQDRQSEKLCCLLMEAGHSIRYYRNSPSLGQAGNVNRLFDLAQGDRLVLLHDDDLLLPDAIAQMSACWQQYPELVACFGKQYIIDTHNQILQDQTDRLNNDYHRTPERAGLQASTLWSAMSAQFPNNAYMILTQAACDTRYEPDGGDACDFEFALRLAQKYAPFYFLNHYTAMYRLTDISVANSVENDAIVSAYRALEMLAVPDDLQTIKTQRLKHLSLLSVHQWLKLGNPQAAKAIYISAYYSWKNRLHPRGILQGFLIICPDGLRQIVINLTRALSKI